MNPEKKKYKADQKKQDTIYKVTGVRQQKAIKSPESCTCVVQIEPIREQKHASLAGGCGHRANQCGRGQSGRADQVPSKNDAFQEQFTFLANMSGEVITV